MEAWAEQTSGRFTLRLYPGGHFFLKSYQPMVLRDISAVL
jgi:surfactin synthase thioesterase subunit